MVDSKDWLEVEAYLEKQEREALAKEGISLPEDHYKGYKYTPTTKIVTKQPWDVKAVPCCNPQANSFFWSHKDVNFEIGQGIAYITLNRPADNNALNDTMSQALHDAAFELHERRDIRVVVLRAEGKMFCAGSTPNSFSDAAALSAADSRKASASFMKFLHFFQCLPQFTIALVQGSAMGSGIGLLSACDMVVSVKAARFTVSEVKLGVAPVTIAPFVTQKVGMSNAKRILCTAENLTADKMLEVGFLNEVVDDPSGFSGIVSEICGQMTNCAPAAVSRAKRLVQNIASQPVSGDVLEYTAKELASIRTGEEAAAGTAAVQSKTRPPWADFTIKPLY